MTAERIRRVARDEWVAGHAGFWWGVAEGIAFFIAPDVYISFATLFSVRAGAIAWVASIAGSLVAVATIYLLTLLPLLDYTSFLESVPGISERLIRQVAEEMERSGLPYTPLLVLGGVPLKVYGAIAFSLGMPLGAVMLWTAFGRIVRIAPTFLVAAAIRARLGRHIDAHPAAWTAALGVFWIGFYTFYFMRVPR